MTNKNLSDCAFRPLGQISLERLKISSSRCFEPRLLSITSFHPASTETRRRPPSGRPFAFNRNRKEKKKKKYTTTALTTTTKPPGVTRPALCLAGLRDGVLDPSGKLFRYVMRIMWCHLQHLRQRHNVSAFTLHVQRGGAGGGEKKSGGGRCEWQCGWCQGVLTYWGRMALRSGGRRVIYPPFFSITGAFLLRAAAARCNCLPGICLHYQTADGISYK